MFLGLTEKEGRRKKEENQGFLPRSTEFQWSVLVGPRTKVHRVDERYTWVPENRDFAKDPRGEILGNQSCRV